MTISLQLPASQNLDLALTVYRDNVPLTDGSPTDPESAGQGCLRSVMIDSVFFRHSGFSMACHTNQSKNAIPEVSYAEGMESLTTNDRINEVIRDSGREPAEIARAIGITKQTMNDWTQFRTKNPQNAKLLAFADEMGVELRWLISGKGPKEVRTRNAPEIQKATDLLAVMPQDQRTRLVEYLESASKAA